MLRHAALALLLCAGCLPADERPEPGSVLMNVERSDDVRDGFTTDDGWHITFDRFVTALGGVTLFDDGCIPYTLFPYDRLYDFAAADTSKVSLQYGLGACTLTFQLRNPSPRSLLMQGVSEADRELMNVGDKFEEADPFSVPVALWVVGRAEREGVVKQIDWLLRRSHTIGRCHPPQSDDDLSAIVLESGASHTRAIVMRPRELFRITPSLESPIEFSRIAVADIDMDGEVTLEELADVEIDAEVIAEDLEDELPSELQGLVEFAVDKITLLDLIGKILSGRVASLSGAGECEVFYHL